MGRSPNQDSACLTIHKCFLSDKVTHHSPLTLQDSCIVCCLSLVSGKGRHKIYIGETECIAQRLKQHNSGSGALDTRDPSDRPWALVSYMCGLAHMRTRERMSLERTWQGEVQRQRHRGKGDVYSWITAGAYVVQTHNSDCAVEEDHIRFVLMVSPDATSDDHEEWVVG